MNFYKCTDCWRVYSEEVTGTGYFDGCKCGNIRFKQKRYGRWIKIKAWLSTWL